MRDYYLKQNTEKKLRRREGGFVPAVTDWSLTLFYLFSGKKMNEWRDIHFLQSPDGPNAHDRDRQREITQRSEMKVRSINAPKRSED